MKEVVRRIPWLVAVIVVGLTPCAAFSAEYSGGKGTAKSPFQIGKLLDWLLFWQAYRNNLCLR